MKTMMNKAGGNAAWNQLSAADRKKLEGWLMDDGLSYRQALAKARKEFGFSGSLASMQRFHFRLSQTRVMQDLGESLEQAREIEGAAATAEVLRQASVKLMAQALFRQVTTAPDKVSQWAWLAKLLLQSEENEIRRRVAAEAQALSRERLELSRKRFEYDAVEDAVAALPALKAMEKSRTAKSSRRQRIQFEASMLATRTQMFGRIVRGRYKTDDPKERAEIDAECERILQIIRKGRERTAAREEAIEKALVEVEEQEKEEGEWDDEEDEEDESSDDETDDEEEEDETEDDDETEGDDETEAAEDPETAEPEATGVEPAIAEIPLDKPANPQNLQP